MTKMEHTGNNEFPKAFIDKMERLLGREAPEFFESYENERSYGLRRNPLKPCYRDDENFRREEKLFQLRKIPWADDGYFYDANARPGRHPYHEAGAYYIQEPSAMAAAEALNPKPGEKILDLCAAPGGKSTQIAGKMGGKGLLVCNEIHSARAKILSQNVERMGISNAVVTNEDSGRLAAVFLDFFDGVAVDAPCSGEGMFRKDENARLEWSEAQVGLCASRQAEILENAASMTRPGGRIVYSTCTFSPEENEDTILRFLTAHPEFSLEETGISAFFSPGRPEWASDTFTVETVREEVKKAVRIWPHKSEGEGHFLALMRKAGNEGGAKREKRTEPTPTGRKGRLKENDCRLEDYMNFCRGALHMPDLHEEKVSMPQTGFCNSLPGGGILASAKHQRLIFFGDQLYRLPEGLPGVDGLRVLRPGLHLGSMKRGRFEPSHALALILKKEQVVRWADVGSGELAGRYLRGEALSAPLVGECKLESNGWTLILTDGCSLGWAKLSGGVLKNHYPKGLRLP